MYTKEEELVMSTILTKPITRRLGRKVKDGSKYRELEGTVDPGGLLTLRPKGTLKGGVTEVYIDLISEYTQRLYRKYR